MSRAKKIIIWTVLGAAYAPVLMLLEWALVCDFEWRECGWLSSFANIHVMMLSNYVPFLLQASIFGMMAWMILVNALIGALIGSILSIGNRFIKWLFIFAILVPIGAAVFYVLRALTE